MTVLGWAGAAFGVGAVMSVVASRPKGGAGGWRIALEVLLSLGGAVLALVGGDLAVKAAGQKIANTRIWFGVSGSHPLVAAGFGCALLGIMVGAALRRDVLRHPLVQLVWSAAIGALVATVVLPGVPGRVFEVRAGEVSAVVLGVALLARLGVGGWVRATIPADVNPPPPEAPVAPTWRVGAPLGAGDGVRLDACLGEWEGLLDREGSVVAEDPDRRRPVDLLARRPRGLRRYCGRLRRGYLVGAGLAMSVALAAVVGLARAGEDGQTLVLAWWAAAFASVALGSLIRPVSVRYLEELIPAVVPSPPVLVARPVFDLPDTGLEEALLAAVPDTVSEACASCASSGRVKKKVSEEIPGYTETVHHGIYGENPDYTTDHSVPPRTVIRRVSVVCSACAGSGSVPHPLGLKERQERARQLAHRLRNLASRQAALDVGIDAENRRRLVSYGVDRAFFDALDG
jgi:hypothetical protein